LRKQYTDIHFFKLFETSNIIGSYSCLLTRHYHTLTSVDEEAQSIQISALSEQTTEKLLI